MTGESVDADLGRWRQWRLEREMMALFATMGVEKSDEDLAAEVALWRRYGQHATADMIEAAGKAWADPEQEGDR